MQFIFFQTANNQYTVSRTVRKRKRHFKSYFKNTLVFSSSSSKTNPENIFFSFVSRQRNPLSVWFSLEEEKDGKHILLSIIWGRLGELAQFSYVIPVCCLWMISLLVLPHHLGHFVLQITSKHKDPVWYCRYCERELAEHCAVGGKQKCFQTKASLEIFELFLVRKTKQLKSKQSPTSRKDIS